MSDITELYCVMDEFCKEFEPEMHKRMLDNGIRKRRRATGLSLAELMTVLVLFHQLRYRHFKSFYLHHVGVHLRKEFPRQVSYQRCVELMPRACAALAALFDCLKGECTGISFVDSTLVINHLGELLGMSVTAGNVDDRKALRDMTVTPTLFGTLFADKGYIAQWLTQLLRDNDTALVTRVRKNMAQPQLSPFDQAILDHRGLIETVFDQLKNLSQIEHTRHRSVANFAVNLLSGIVAYCLQPHKPSLPLFAHDPNRLVPL